MQYMKIDIIQQCKLCLGHKTQKMAELRSAIFWVLNCPIYLLRCYSKNPALCGFLLYFGANTIVAIAPIILQEFIKVKYKILIFGLSGHCPDLRPGLTWSCSGWNWIKLESVYLDSPYATARYDFFCIRRIQMHLSEGDGRLSGDGFKKK